MGFTKQTNFLPRCRTFKKEKRTLPRPTAEKIIGRRCLMSVPKVKVKGHQAWVIETTHRCLLSKARASKGKNWLLVKSFLSWKEVILRQDVPETFTKQTNFLPRRRTFKKEKRTLPDQPQKR